MPRLISVSDAKRRDAAVEMHGPKKPDASKQVSAEGKPLTLERLIKSTDMTSYEALLRKFGDDTQLAAGLVGADPEIDLECCGRKLGYASRVYVNQKGEVLYAARTLLVVTNPDGSEKQRNDFIDVEATLGEEMPPLMWTGKLLSKEEVVRKYAFVRKMQICHVNGLTFDFLFEMARTLHEEKKMLLVGAGAKAQLPLIFQTNGSPFRGFLEGRIDGTSYSLVLHLSNLELRKPV